jgi:alkanesulfonate monooxygenase SsuD/methylene tetrahydromethanopterin reductase-like flavin-dependent oxidoreductase (luciferase family)
LELGVHLPLIEFGDEGQSLGRLARSVDAARDFGFSSVSVNDHFVFARPWLDGPTALAAVCGRSGSMDLATTLLLVTLRGPVPVAKTFAALDVLSDGRLAPGVGPGSSARDYDALGLDVETRWKRFDEAAAILRAILHGEPAPPAPRWYSMPGPDEAAELCPARRIPLWIGSWGSAAGLRRVARLGDGWLASAYNTTPDRFEQTARALAEQLREHGRRPEGFPNALATMWTCITEDRGEAERVIVDVLAPLLGRDPDLLRGQVCVGPAEDCAELLSRYARAGCRRVYLWPIGDEPRQIERAATQVAPKIGV